MIFKSNFVYSWNEMQKEELIQIHTLFEKTREEMEREYFKNSASGMYEELAPSSENKFKKMLHKLSKIKKLLKK